MGRVGSALDIAAAESFKSTLEFELLGSASSGIPPTWADGKGGPASS
jgi:hypothetical protein